MTPLPDRFRFDGFDFELVQREGDVALLRKSKPHHRDPSYEVVIVQKHKANKWPNGTSSPDRESMPHIGQWGTTGWTYSDLPSAKTRFNTLVNAAEDSAGKPPDAPEAPNRPATAGQNSSQTSEIDVTN